MPDLKLFYPLFDEFEQEFFPQLLKAIAERYTFSGNPEEQKYFLKTLLCFQMLKDYRAPLAIVKEKLALVTDLVEINRELRKENLKIDYSWAVWSRDKVMGELAEKLMDKDLKIAGSQADYDEFVLRYLVSAWLTDWEGPLYAILQLTVNGTCDLQECNNLIAKWDFTGIFAYV